MVAAIATPILALALWQVMYVYADNHGANGGDTTFGWLPVIVWPFSLTAGLGAAVAISLVAVIRPARRRRGQVVTAMVVLAYAVLVAYVDFWSFGLSGRDDPFNEGFPASTTVTAGLVAGGLLTLAPALALLGWAVLGPRPGDSSSAPDEVPAPPGSAAHG